MRVGLFGSIILLVLTLIFSFIAIQNNKFARQVAIKEFGLDKNNSLASKKEDNQTNSKNIVQNVQNTDNFNKQFSNKFKEFDKKFNSF